MDTPEYQVLERIVVATPNKICMPNRARREIPLRKAILSTRYFF